MSLPPGTPRTSARGLSVDSGGAQLSAALRVQGIETMVLVSSSQAPGTPGTPMLMSATQAGVPL